jgi:hypothetical protein
MPDPSEMYPPPGPDEVLVRPTIAVSKDIHGDMELVVELWNVTKRRRVTWKITSLVRHFVTLGLEAFWREQGGRPKTAEARRAHIDRLIAEHVAKHGDPASTKPRK